MTVEGFIDRYGDESRYQLIDGELVEMEPTGPHVRVASPQELEIAAFISRKLNVEIDRQNSAYFIPHRCLIKGLGTATAFRPDIVVLDKTQLVHEPLWQQKPVITLGTSIKMAIEVVSTNWQNDYARKKEDYALLGIPEYLIVDYLGLGGRDYIGKSKQPTLTFCTLVGDEYEKKQYCEDALIKSQVFPELTLKANQIFDAASR